MGNTNQNSHFTAHYESGDIIGRGTFAVVKKCFSKVTKKEFAVKIVDKRQLTGKELVLLKDEVKMLNSVENLHVVKMFDVFDNGSQVKMVLELCTGGNLLDLIHQQPHGRLNEIATARITSIIARTLKYLHSHHIVHRDLKPENILFTDDGTLKITDLGLAHYMKVSQDLHYMHTCCGTPHYVAPEVLTSNGVGTGQFDHYGYKVDYWSLGVMSYLMLSGKQAFNSRSINAMYQLIIQGKYQFTSPTWDNVSQDAVDLIKKLMCVDPEQRMTYDALIQHPWIAQYVDENEMIKEEETYLQELQELQRSLKSSITSNTSVNNNINSSNDNNSSTEQNINNTDTSNDDMNEKKVSNIETINVKYSVNNKNNTYSDEYANQPTQSNTSPYYKAKVANNNAQEMISLHAN